MHPFPGETILGLARLLILFLLPSTLWGMQQIHFKNLGRADGLSQSSVFAIQQDRSGFMWFGTEDGLNRYDGYHFKVYRNIPDDPSSLGDNLIRALLLDRKERLWIVTGHGLNRFDDEKDRFIHYVHDPADPGSPSEKIIYSVFQDKSGDLWLGGLKVDRLDEEGRKQEQFETDAGGNPFGPIWVIVQDGSDRIILGCRNGLYRQSGSGQFEPVAGYAGGTTVLTMLLDDRQRLWVGSAGKGAFVFDREGKLITHFQAEPDNERGLPHNRVYSLAMDYKKQIWLGTQGGGLALFDEATQSFTTFRNESHNPRSLNDNHIYFLFSASDHRLWVGCRIGISHFSEHDLRFTHHPHDPTRKGGISASEVWSFLQDRQGNLWVGTSKGLDRRDHQTGAWANFRHKEGDPHSLSGDQISSLFEDRERRLWVGTFLDGLNLYDRDKGHFTPFPQDGDQGPRGYLITSINEDREGRLWVASSGGLNRRNPDGTFKTWQHDPDDPDSIADDKVNTFIEDEKGWWIGTYNGLSFMSFEKEGFFLNFSGEETGSPGNPFIYSLHRTQNRLWVGTRNGLNSHVPGSKTFRVYLERDGLPNNTIYSILEDQTGRLWMSTNKGISCFDPKTDTFRNYNRADGLQADEFNVNAWHRARDGTMYFGGIKGYNTFKPNEVRDNPIRPVVLVTELLLANKPVRPDPQGEGPLINSTHTLEDLTLSYKHDLFSLEFAALHYTNPDGNGYAYMLEGLDRQWIQTDAANRRATYTDLAPGNYIFKVKGSNHDGLWSERETHLAIRILPPPWRTVWAYLAYVLTAFMLIGAWVRSQRKKLAYERDLNRRLTQVDRLKDEFLANTSHELRTPLNGIIGLAESLMDGATGPLSRETRENLAMIVSGGKRLASLVNDILDFSKLRDKNLDLHFEAVDPFTVTEVVLALSKPLAGDKELLLVNDLERDVPAVLADENRLLQIMHNLVGNAIKFTESGTVRVSSHTGTSHLEIVVADTGIGIDPSQHEQIFKSFEQLEGFTERAYGGTGLGLAITRRLVTLHKGEIRVESTPGEGSSFIFSLPLAPTPASKTDHLPATLQRLLPEQSDERHEPAAPSPGEAEPEKPFKVLIVDDEPINRKVLFNHLSLEHYAITQAANGKEALEIIEERGPFDLILLDIMMPRMSGFEVCQELRRRHPVHELPVIFLSARNRVRDLVTGFGSGANDYLTKPISKDELLTRVKTHLDLLDINRTLEVRVAERTSELNQTNQVLKHNNEELRRSRHRSIMQEKMASLGTLASGIAHEIKNPLNFINNFAHINVELADELRETLDDEKLVTSIADILDDMQSNAQAIEKHGERANGIVLKMMELTVHHVGSWRKMDPNSLFDEFTNLAYQRKRADGCPEILIEQRFEPCAPFSFVPQTLSRVFVSLMNNAIEAVLERVKRGEPGYHPNITLETQRGNETFVFRIKDNGVGISEEHKDQIFNPFFTTKPADSQHIGLSLSISYDIIVNEHHGEIHLVQGCDPTVFEVHLKTTEEESPDQDP